MQLPSLLHHQWIVDMRWQNIPMCLRMLEASVRRLADLRLLVVLRQLARSNTRYTYSSYR
jgi:hypothetical protein